jgi:hypothetical protein
MDLIEHGWRRRRRKKERVFNLWALRGGKRRVYIDGHLPVGEKWPPKMMIDDMYCKRSFLREKKPLSLFLSHFILGPYYIIIIIIIVIENSKRCGHSTVEKVLFTHLHFIVDLLCFFFHFFHQIFILDDNYNWRPISSNLLDEEKFGRQMIKVKQ